jgi:hypothetical protein
VDWADDALELDARGAIARRFVRARRSAGLTQADVATRLHIPLWQLDQLEQARRDPRPFVDAIAEITAHQRNWFFEKHRASFRSLGSAEGAEPYVQWRRNLVLGSLVLLVLIRFVTESIPILPRAANFVDIPIVTALSLAALLQRPLAFARRSGPHLGLLVTLFLLACTVATATNPSRVAAAPVLVFVYGFLSPIAMYYATYRLWPPGSALSLSRLLVSLGVLELVVVLAFDLPRFISDGGNPDDISGTFGTNAYQLVFFLLIITALLAGIATFERNRRITTRAAPLLFLCILLTVFLAQYRAVLVAMVITVVLLGILLAQRLRGAVVVLAVASALGASLFYVATSFPGLDFSRQLSTFRRSPEFFVVQRFEAGRGVARLFTDQPQAILIGTGPGTFSSRAWRTFAGINEFAGTNVAGRYASSITGGVSYHTDVSDRYVLPQWRYGKAVLGSTALSSPFSSYFSLLAEAGALGFIAAVTMYLQAFGSSLRMTLGAIRRSVPGDALPALALAATAAFALLIQMAMLDNWFEIARATFPAWMLLAVVVRECDARLEAT